MLKYLETLVTFTEVPDEISLCFNITNCPCNCKGCFEPWLAEDTGEPLTIAAIKEVLSTKVGITCICFMGGDNDYAALYKLCNECRMFLPQYKLAMYSGRQIFRTDLSSVLDYYKIGPYIPERGPMNKETTNQIFYKKENGE